MRSTRLHDQVQAFLEHCEIDRNLSPGTVRMYAHYLDFFQDWAAVEKLTRAEDIDPEGAVARFQHGVLTVQLPVVDKAPAEGRYRITVERFD
jgi:site-specific recombinase XerD